MNTLPLISVIVPAYNSEKWLEECCKSVLCQTYSPIELIIVDDGSTDGTFSLAEGLSESNGNVKVIHTENGGVCRARNTGVAAASGEYIVFLDADDVLTEDAVEVLYQNISKEDADIAIGAQKNMTSEGADLGRPYERTSGVFTGTEGLKLSLSDHPSMYTVWGKLYKRSAIEDVRFADGKKIHEDSFFVFECLLKQPKVVICDHVVISYRITKNSASRSVFYDKFFDILYFADRKKALIEELYPELLPMVENVIVKANMALLRTLCNTNDPKYRDSEKKAIKAVLDRKAYYKPAIKADSKWFWILSHRLYGLYKLAWMLKNKLCTRDGK